MLLQLDRRKPFFPSIHLGAYPMGMIGAFILGETGSAATTDNNIKFYDAVSRQWVQYSFNGDPLLLKQVQNCGGFVVYNTHGTTWNLNHNTRAYDPKTWVIWGSVPPAASGSLLTKNDNNSINAGWMHSIDSTAGVDFSIEFASTNMYVRAAPAGHGPWADCIHCLAFSWDGTLVAANQHVYIDGIPQAHTVNINGAGSHGSDGVNPLIVTGTRLGSGFGGAQTIVESFFLFNRVLSPAEIQELYVFPYRRYTSAMDRMLLGGARHFTQSLDATMQTFDATLTTHLVMGRAKAIAATMLQMAGTLTLRVGKALSAGMATFAATLSAVYIKAGSGNVINASMSTFSATLVKQTDKVLNASMRPFTATLSLAVTHGTVPPTCVPVGCDTLPVLISHVEQCENPGS